jgi:hypothetical protein
LTPKRRTKCGSSGASADRRKIFLLFSDGGALPRRRYANPAAAFALAIKFKHDLIGRDGSTNSIVRHFEF